VRAQSIAARQQEDFELTRSLLRLSEPAFVEIWDNDEDSVYDAP